CGREIPCHR
ncbi:hypothetical protein BVZ69_00237B, partial [Haemophilus influenzae]